MLIYLFLDQYQQLKGYIRKLMLFGALGKNFINDWTDKDQNKAAGPNILQPNIFDKLIVDAFSLTTQQFHQKFLYGQKVMMVQGSKISPMSVYLDNERDKLLWISSKSQAFLLDLYFTKVSIKQDLYFKKSLMKKLSLDKTEQKKYSYMNLRHLQQNIIFAFDTEDERNQYFSLFSLYINELKRQDPNYNIYFSNISKLHAMNTTKSGTNQSSFHAIMEISHKVGLMNKKQNQQILHNCLKIWNVKDQKKIPLNCINEYFRVQFCNRKLQPIYQKFSKPLGNIIKNCKLIEQKNMTIQNFTQFLQTIQKQSPQNMTKILKSHTNNLSFFDFCRYLYDSEINNASHMQQNDLDHPLKDYFCYSSHNTYLSGNQLNSDCKVQRYSQDLETGIKCVELDIHNNGLVPIVTHALNDASFCKPILFEDVIKVVQLFSEKYQKQNKSHYPIILSLENHASNQNREIMLDILTRYFQKKLYYLKGHQKTFPVLSFLMGNIIIKTSSKQQQLRGFHKKVAYRKLGSISQLRSFDNFALSKKKFKDQVLQSKYKQFNSHKDELQRRMFKFNGRMEILQRVYIPVSSMGKLTTIFKSEKGIAGGGISEFQCVSYTNQKVLKSNPEQLISYTKTSWLRTYPIGTQIASSNYDPCGMLAVGAQIIALNTQTKDYYAWLMNGYFCGGHASKNQSQGYVLKPKKLLHPQLYKDLPKMLRILTIQLIETGAQNIQMKFFGLPQDNQLNANSTNQFRFYNPDESFIVFNIGDQFRDCVAIRWIREGYRIIQGKNINNYMDCGRRVLIKISLVTA